MATRIKNLDKLNRKLRNLSHGEIVDAISIAMAKGANDIVAMAKRFAPVDTGALRDSIGWTWGREIPEGATALGTIGGKKKGKDNLIITVYAGSHKVFYAKWREFGTVTQKAHPYFFPSYRAQRKPIKAAIRRAVRKAARTEASR